MWDERTRVRARDILTQIDMVANWFFLEAFNSFAAPALQLFEHLKHFMQTTSFQRSRRIARPEVRMKGENKRRQNWLLVEKLNGALQEERRQENLGGPR